VATLKLGVLVSGRGTNLQAVLDAVAQDRLDGELRVVISNKPNALALERAAQVGVPTCVIEHRRFPSREAFDAALVEKLKSFGVEWVVLAGFMRVLTGVFIGGMQGRIVNIHPALLPSFPGVHAQRQALEYGVKVTGCTVHLIDEGVDTGPILAQRAVPVQDGDTEETLSARILKQEHALLVSVLQGLADGSIEPPLGKRRTRQGPASE
jgi:phosphoribosylglycinamide formyltransferase-1